MFNKILFFILISISFNGCFVPQNPYTGLTPGPWRATLKLERYATTPSGEDVSENRQVQFEEVTAGELPFNFEVIYKNENDFYIEIKNGDELIRIDNVIIGRDRKTAKDTIVITFPDNTSYIKGIFQENVIEGAWVTSDSVRVPFVAKQGQNHRFTTLRKTPVMDVSGAWNLAFDGDSIQSQKTIIQFKQENNYLTGTFQKGVNKPIQMEGTVQANKLYLSGFDGAIAVLIEGKLQPDGTLIGSFYGGLNEKTTWNARRLAQ